MTNYQTLARTGNERLKKETNCQRIRIILLNCGQLLTDVGGTSAVITTLSHVISS